MELYIQDLTLFTINRGHRDTRESRDGNNKEEERLSSWSNSRPWRGVCLRFILCIYSFSGECGHYEATKTTLSYSDCAVPKAAAQYLALTHLFILLAQFHCYMPGFSVADDQYRLNHFWIFTLKQKWIYFITSIYLLQHIFWSHPFFLCSDIS